MSAEQAVLGCLLRDNRVYRDIADLTGDDFQDPRLGAVFDGLLSDIASGRTIDTLNVETRFGDYGAQGVGPEQPWAWVDHVTIPQMIGSYAQAVKTDSLRRNGTEVMRVGIQLLSDNTKNPAETWEQVKSALTRRVKTPARTFTLREILELEDSADWVIPGLMERKDRLILTGHEGLGKTTMVRQLLILPAAGIHPFTFEQIEPVTALVVDAENTGKQWMRATRWVAAEAAKRGAVDPADRIRLMLSGRLNILDPAELGGIHRLIDEHDPGVVFIGPLYRLALRMNSDDDIAPVIAALDSIRDRGVALVIEAHAGHAIGVNGVRDVRPRGSSALLGWPEFGYGIRKGDGDLFDFIAWRGARETRDWPERLRRGGPGQFPWQVVPDYE